MAYMYSIDVQPRAETSTFGALYTLLEKMDYNYLVAQDTFTAHTTVPNMGKKWGFG